MLFQRNYTTSAKALNLPAETKFASVDFCYLKTFKLQAEKPNKII